LEFTDAALEHIAREGYDPVFGARPLRRYLQREVETKLGRALIAGNIAEGTTLQVDFLEPEGLFIAPVAERASRT
jgi:ATP-dependent Clp protease ATP-binding subunit ClpB